MSISDDIIRAYIASDPFNTSLEDYAAQYRADPNAAPPPEGYRGITQESVDVFRSTEPTGQTGAPGGASGSGTDPRVTELENQLAALRAQIANLEAARAAEKRQRDAEASSMLKDMFSQWGMSDLVPVIDGLVREFGNSIPVLAEKVRTTDAYKTRFRGLVELQAKGITDVRNEAEYINLESQYRQVFREAGIQSYIGDAGSKPEQSAIADLVGKFSLSVNEVRSRVADAQRVVNDTAPEVKDALQRFYNVAPQDLVAYTLDPQRTMDRINRIANAAMIGGYAQARDLTVDLGTAESLANLSGGNDMNPERLATDLSAARAVRDATRRLASIEDTTLEDSEVVRSQMGVDPEAQRKVRGLQSRERARFSGTSAINAGSLSRSGGV